LAFWNPPNREEKTSNLPDGEFRAHHVAIDLFGEVGEIAATGRAKARRTI
jgi:hypothetical protein